MRIKLRVLTTILVVSGMLVHAWAATPAPKNLQLSTFGSISSGQYTVFAASEYAQQSDLNGDGDQSDNVLHVRDGARGTTTNVGVASGAMHFDGRFIAFLVPENSQGAIDLNGDGDTFDQVLHVYDVTLGRMRNLGIASTYLLSLGGGIVATRVPESLQGGQDLNGDGDAFDQVVFVHDARKGVTKNLGLAGYVPKVDAGLVAFSVSEAQQGGIDLNGNGSTFDYVMHVHDVSTGTTANTGMPALQVDAMDGGLVMFRVGEYAHGADLNGDGDLSDIVPHIYAAKSKTLAGLGFACSYPGLLDGGVAAVQISEWSEGKDLNGDGDVYDNVVSLYDVPAGAWTHLGLAAFGSLRLEQRRVACTVFESFQGGQDLNGDGDAWDQVIHVHDMNTGCTKALGAGVLIEIVGSHLCYTIAEASEGGVDFNGDGDIIDRVLHVFDVASGTVTNHALAVSGSEAGSTRVLLQVAESYQGGTDLNGDGDALDSVVHVLALPANNVLNLKLAGQVGRYEGAGHSMYAFSVSEFSEGKDLNGDGDMVDQLVHTSR